MMQRLPFPQLVGRATISDTPFDEIVLTVTVPKEQAAAITNATMRNIIAGIMSARGGLSDAIRKVHDA